MHEWRGSGTPGAQVPGLPQIPGGWTTRTLRIGGESFELVLPACPDAFLDDAGVLKRHERDGYMPYWAYLWPASIHLAAFVLKRPWPVGTHVWELGCGLGLVGLAALHAGYQVTFSDYDPQALEACLWNARRWGYLPQAERLDWRQAPERQVPVILGCELLYEDAHHEPLLELLRRWLPRTGEAWFGDAGRVKAERFFKMLPDYGLIGRVYDEQQRPLASLRVGEYQQFEIRKTLSENIDF